MVKVVGRWEGMLVVPVAACFNTASHVTFFFADGGSGSAEVDSNWSGMQGERRGGREGTTRAVGIVLLLLIMRTCLFVVDNHRLLVVYIDMDRLQSWNE